MYRDTMLHFRNYVQSIDWEHYKKWLYNNKNKYYARFLLSGAKKWHNYAFSNELVELSNDRNKDDILKAVTNLTRYFDINHDTTFHEEFLQWLKRKEIKWKSKRTLTIPNEIPLDTILSNMRTLEVKYQIFAIFALVSGLRTFECIKALNHHSELCRDGIMEMYWDRITKKTNAVFCHPLLHDKLNYTYSENTIHSKIRTKVLGCKISYLRKLNFTINATKVDPLLAEFMQGRRGNISQRHYFLPSMQQHRSKWLKTWTPLIHNILS